MFWFGFFFFLREDIHKDFTCALVTGSPRTIYTLLHDKDTELHWNVCSHLYIKLARIAVLFGDSNNNKVQFKRNALEFPDYFTSLQKQMFSLKKRKSVIISLLVYLPQWFFLFVCYSFFKKPSYLVFQLHQLEIMLKKACIPFLAICNAILETNCFCSGE